MNQLKMQNPQAFQQISQLRNSGANPSGIIKQMLGNTPNEKIQAIFNQAKQMGVPDNVLSQIQNMR